MFRAYSRSGSPLAIPRESRALPESDPEMTHLLMSQCPHESERMLAESRMGLEQLVIQHIQHLPRNPQNRREQRTKNGIFTANSGPPPPTPQHLLKFSKSALPWENPHGMDLVNLGGGGMGSKFDGYICIR